MQKSYYFSCPEKSDSFCASNEKIGALFQNFEIEKILTADQKLPLVSESAREKMRMVKEILA